MGKHRKFGSYRMPNEVGCYNCVRWRNHPSRCKDCIGFSEFKNIDTLNAELKEKGLNHLYVNTIEDLRRRDGF